MARPLQMGIPEENVLRSSTFKQLRWSLQALALTDSVQRALFPDAAVTADELALDFDHRASAVRGNYDHELSRPQIDALTAIERKLATMSRDGAEFDVELWTDAALQTSEHWSEIRKLATVALEAFDWPVERPPEHPARDGMFAR